MRPMGAGELERMASELAESMAKPHCRACRCLQDFLTRLMRDADGRVAEMLSPWRVDRAKMHRRGTCESCPPADLFAEYLKEGGDDGQGILRDGPPDETGSAKRGEIDRRLSGLPRGVRSLN